MTLLHTGMRSTGSNGSTPRSAGCRIIHVVLTMGLPCLLSALILAGCASHWEIHTDSSDTQFLWPTLPEKPRIKYVMSVKGFDEVGMSLKSILLGKASRGLARPVAAATGSDGRLAIADTESKCVHLYIPAEKNYIAITQTDQESLESPVGIVFDEALRLYVADSALQKIMVFDKKGAYLFSFNEASFERPTGLAYNKDRKVLYVIDTVACKIYALNQYGEVIFSFGERGEEAGMFNFPTHIFWSSAGLLYITDSMNFRVQIFDESGNFKTAFGHHGDGSGDFAMPKGVAVDEQGTIYVVDALFDNVQLFNERGEFLLTLGSRGYEQGEFWLPNGIFIDDNKMYVSDTFNQRVQVFELLRKEYE